VKGATNAYFSSPLSIGVKSRLHSLTRIGQFSKSEIPWLRQLTTFPELTSTDGV
jgi:hypothetical protein